MSKYFWDIKAEIIKELTVDTYNPHRHIAYTGWTTGDNNYDKKILELNNKPSDYLHENHMIDFYHQDLRFYNRGELYTGFYRTDGLDYHFKSGKINLLRDDIKMIKNAMKHVKVCLADEYKDLTNVELLEFIFGFDIILAKHIEVLLKSEYKNNSITKDV